MNHDVLSTIWHFLLALVWSIYIIQESFVIGVSILSFKFSGNDVKKLNSLVGTYWDGIQVWLILAVAGLLAAFPSILAILFTNIYVAVFLLLYAIVFRGVSIELIYKSNNIKYQNIITKTWQISSFVLFLVIGVYITNLFKGYPVGTKSMNQSFFSFLHLFNLIGILGGILFIAYSFISAYNFTKLNGLSELSLKMKYFAKWSSIVTIISLIGIFMGLNNKFQVFSKPEGLYLKYPFFWVIPILSILLMILNAYLTWKDKTLMSFIISSISILLFIFSGFTAMFPYAFVSTISPEFSTTISNGAASSTTLTVMLIATCLFLPVVLFYQGFKYVKFWGNKYN